MFKLKPKNDFFFEHFDIVAKNCYDSALALDDLLNDFSDIDNKIKHIEDLEHNGDMLSHDIITHLKKSFITPIDKEDIYIITNQLDDIVDRIQTVAFRIDMLNLSHITEEAKLLSSNLVKCTNKLPELVGGLKNLKNTNTLKETIIEINSIENDGDEIFRSAVKNLFRSDEEDIEKMKLKEIYELLEECIDACEDVGDKIEEVVMKHA